MIRSFGLDVAYLVNTYPRASHTFIRRELMALGRMGWTPHRFAMRSDREKLVDPGDLAEDALTEHVLETKRRVLLASIAKFGVTHPRHFLSAMVLALKCGRRGLGGGSGTGGYLKHLFYLAEATHIARRCSHLGLKHIHAHFGTNSATVAMLAAHLADMTFSVTVHGPEEFDSPRSLALDLKIERAAFVVAISSFGRSQLCRLVGPEHWDRIKVIRCGVEAEKFPRPMPIPSGPPRLVVIGRLSEQKGLPVLIEALALVREKHPDLHTTLVGDGELRGELESQLRRLSLTEAVTLAGWQDEKEVRASLAASHALVLPSFAEGLPMVLMEAFASGRPVIATLIAGIPELVTKQTGWLVPAGSPEALANAISELATTDRETLADMGAKGRERVLQMHDINIEARKLADNFLNWVQH